MSEVRVPVLPASPETPRVQQSCRVTLHRPIKEQTEIMFCSKVISKLLCNVSKIIVDASQGEGSAQAAPAVGWAVGRGGMWGGGMLPCCPLSLRAQPQDSSIQDLPRRGFICQRTLMAFLGCVS